MGRVFFIAGGCIAGVFIFSPGSGHQRDARNGGRCQKSGAPWCELLRAAQISGFDLPVRVLSGHKKIALLN